MTPGINLDSGGSTSDETIEGQAGSNVPRNLEEKIGFELNPQDSHWVFAPTYYPDRLVQNKDREVERDGRQCGGEDITIKNIKNREFHVNGVLLSYEIPIFQNVLEYEGEIDLISPLTPSGGMECKVKESELGELAGWDPLKKAWRFEYSVDLVSTGRDEHGSGNNDIVSAIIGTSSGSGTPQGSGSGGYVI